MDNLSEDLNGLNKIALNEMVNWNQTKTGLPCIVSLQVPATDGRTYNHKSKRIDFQNNKSTRFQSSQCLPLDIETGEELVKNKKYDKQLEKEVLKWIQVNKELLLNIWDGVITPEEAEEFLKTV